MLGGSHAYGLNTPQSDLDYRGVYSSNGINTILGLCQQDFATHTEISTDDNIYYELRKYLSMLRKTNSVAIELLYNEDWLHITPLFQLIQAKRELLIDSHCFYKSLKGYMLGELKLATGERTGKLGGKRKESIDELGFSPKNFVQLLRLATCGAEFFKTGNFPLRVESFSKEFRDMLLEIKLEPKKHWTKESLCRVVGAAELCLDLAYQQTKISYHFDDKVANNILMLAYNGALEHHKVESSLYQRLASDLASLGS